MLRFSELNSDSAFVCSFPLILYLYSGTSQQVADDWIMFEEKLHDFRYGWTWSARLEPYSVLAQMSLSTISKTAKWTRAKNSFKFSYI